MELKEFFFMRHGQTNHNAGKIPCDHLDISLNLIGQNQAKAIEPTINKLSIKTICHSPLKRAIETKDIITCNFTALHREIADLSECSMYIWKQMTEPNVSHSSKPQVQAFIERIGRGLSAALKEPSPMLIVAHGGVYWAICHLMRINTERIDHCIPVHFTVCSNGQWAAKKLY